MPRNYPASVPFRTASEANLLKLAAAKASKTVPKLTPIRPHHKRDFGRFRDDAAKQGRRAFRTPIRGCDIFRKATRGRRFLDVAKMTSQRTSATRNFALRHRHMPRPAAQNVAQTWPKKRTARTRGWSRFRKATPERRFFDVVPRVQKPLQISSGKHTPVYQCHIKVAKNAHQSRPP